MNDKLLVDSNILFFAFRYALGRRSYAPSVVIDNILKNLNDISSEDISRYIKEIEECKDFGMEIDEKNWKELKRVLSVELERR